MPINDDIRYICGATRGPLRQALINALSSDDAAPWHTLNAVCHSRKKPADALARAAARARERRHPAHERLLAAALALDPWHPAATEAMAHSYLGRGLGAQACKLVVDLRRHALSRKRPTPPDGLLLACATAAGQTDEAQAAAYRIAVDPAAKWDDMLAAGEFFRAQNDLDAQRTLFTRMTGERPNDPSANLLMAAWLNDEGYEDEAARHIQRVIDHAADRPQRLAAERLLFEVKHPQDHARFKEIIAGFYAARPEDVIEPLREITGKHPDLAEAWLFLGLGLRRARRLGEAAQALGQAAQIADDPMAHKELGGVLGELGDPQRSIAHSLRALELLGEQDKVLWLNLAAAQLELGDFGACRDALGRARDLDPASKALARLEEALAARLVPRRGFFDARHYVAGRKRMRGTAA